jgi:predicted small metal-binding protein
VVPPFAPALDAWYILLGACGEVNFPWEVAMAKSFQCRDGGVICNAKITGEMEEDVVRQAVEHARDAHGVDLTQSTTLARYAQSLIRDAGGER